MGDIENQIPHERRSSSMDFALRWIKRNKKAAGIAAASSLGLMLLFVVLLYGADTKRVAISIDGQETVYETRLGSLTELLQEKGILVDEKDRLSVALDHQLKNGDSISILTTVPVLLTMDGKTQTVYSTGKTVGGVLTDLQVAVDEDDKVVPSVHTEINGQAEIQVVRVTKTVKEVEVPIAYDTVKKKDSSMLKGKQEVVQEGKEGMLLVKKEQIFEDGKLVAESTVDETVNAVSIDKIVAIGTKAPAAKVVRLSSSSPSMDELTKNGITFGYKQLLNNVTLTAYSLSVASTGKDESHPQYGLTSSGARVTEGRTIAVDKDVIPMGWWVYIEGIGFRRAEDTGSAVKGNKIDIYFDDPAYAAKFGMKSGYKVYIIGPKKPAAD